MVGHKLGEFAPTRTFKGHAADDKNQQITIYISRGGYLMEAKAVARTIRIAPRKVRLVLDLIRGKNAGEAIAILKLTNKASSPVIEKY